ncbi:hypothetical protein EC988_000139 [Linderina pennispora]|nr:hypothetical protein EC988_000139 [Linderina pennispora]
MHMRRFPQLITRRIWPHPHERMIQHRSWHSQVRKGDTVYVGMSGGVDSSVTALLLQQQGLHVEGVFMRNWDTRDERGECPSERDWRDVQRVCRQLDMKCHEVNLVKEYWNSVFSVALDEYQHGRTPNPDVLCNKEIKFGVLLREIARRLGDAWFATGHYARAVRKGSGEMALLRGVDERKDQSYYLSAVSSRQLDRVLFPLGGLRKAEDVRALAQQAGLATAQKEESMGICFVGERRRFDEFLAEYLPQVPGDIVSSEGKKLGTHSGLFTKTIGQSAGISGWQEKWYVYAKDIASNRMYAAQNRNNPLLYTHQLTAGPAHWISSEHPLPGEMHGLEAQIRYMQKPQRCSVLNGSSKLTVTFDNPQFGVATGQYLVFMPQGLATLAPIAQTGSNADVLTIEERDGMVEQAELGFRMFLQETGSRTGYVLYPSTRQIIKALHVLYKVLDDIDFSNVFE